MCVQVRRCKCACACACMFILVYITAVKGRTHIEYVHIYIYITIYIYIHTVCWNWGWNPVSCPKGNHLPDLLQPHLKAGGFSRWRLFWSHKEDSEVNPIINHPQLKKKQLPAGWEDFVALALSYWSLLAPKKLSNVGGIRNPLSGFFAHWKMAHKKGGARCCSNSSVPLGPFQFPGDEFAANSWKTPESIVQEPWLTTLLPSGNDVPQLLAFLPRAH